VTVAEPHARERIALDVCGVTVRRWDAAARVVHLLLADVTLRVEAGEHWVVLGPNGAGKTTLLRLLGAVDQPSSGTVDVLGHRLGRVDVRTLREAIGFVEPKLARSFAERLSVRDVVLTGATASIALQPRRLADADGARADRLLELVGCGALAARRFADCSQGERQRVLLARATMRDCDLLLLDEPTTGLDLPSREALLSALRDLARDRRQLTSVTITHHLEEMPSHATHALLLRGGRVLAAGALDEVVTSERVSACFGTPIAVERVRGRYLAVGRA